MSNEQQSDEPVGEHPVVPESACDDGLEQPPAPVERPAQVVQGSGGHLSPHRRFGRTAMTVAALGIVFGDIGTSPLYALRETLEHNHITPDMAGVYGVLSLVTWSMLLIVSVKYLAFVMRADNHGEGGILALTSLLKSSRQHLGGVRAGKVSKSLVALGLFGTALLYGDGIITPAISVVAAVEGIERVVPAAGEWVVPVATVILLALFAVQRRGTAAVGKAFGPVMVVWFTTLAALGVWNIVKHPGVLQAFNPQWAVRFFVDNGWTAVLAMGAVFLVVTGGEALYADMGHFGRTPIVRGWLFVAFPALVLNYFGQGALLLEHPDALESPFFAMAPSVVVWPLLVLATCATVIASQALISGAFSLTAQAVKLGYLPRMRILHTSNTEVGQVYCPTVNWALMVGSIAVVWVFETSSRIANAYGMAVTLTMVVTTILYGFLMRSKGWSQVRVAVVCGAFLVLELFFLAGNVVKIPHGGWVAVTVGVLLYALMNVWSIGKSTVRQEITDMCVDLNDFVRNLDDVPRTSGVAVYMTSIPDVAPPPLMMNVEYHGSLHERVAVVRVVVSDEPYVAEDVRATCVAVGCGVELVVLRYGWADDVDVPHDLRALCDIEDPVWFIGRENVVVTPVRTMSPLGEHLYSRMQRNETAASEYFGLPIDKTMEVGVRLGI